MPHHLRVSLAGFTVALLAIVIYWPGLQGSFFFDDEANILLREAIHLETLTSQSIREAMSSGIAGPSGRPVSQLSFALNYYVTGFSPFAFKAINLAIHIANALLVFSLTLRLLKMAKPQSQQSLMALVAGGVATIWLLHPIQLASVLYVVQRMTSLSAFFLLAALLLHTKARSPGARFGIIHLIFAWGLFWPLSFLSKETGALFPLFVLTWELTLRQSSCGRLDNLARALTTGSCLVLLLGVSYGLSPAGQWLWAGYEFRPFSLFERLLTEGRVLFIYLGLILFPRLEALGLHHDDIALSSGLLTPGTTIFALTALIGSALLAWRLRHRTPLYSLGIGWFLIGHGLESTFLPLEIAHEHRNYLPLLGILLICAGLLVGSMERSGARRTLGMTLVLVTLTYFPFVTALRAHQFGEEVRRTQIEAQHHPQSARAHYDAGRILATLPDSTQPNSPSYFFARSHYELATELDSDSKLGWLGLIHLSCKANTGVDPKWVQELARRLNETPFAPGDRNLLFSLKEMSIAGSICLPRTDIDNLFIAAISNPGIQPWVQSTLHSWHADYLVLHEQDIAAARAALTKSLTLNPLNPSNRLKWAQLLLISGEKDEARKLLIELQNTRFPAKERKVLNEISLALGIMERNR